MSSRVRDTLNTGGGSSHGSSERISFGTGSTGSRSGSHTSGSSSRFKRRLINAMNRTSLYSLAQQAETTVNWKFTVVGFFFEVMQWLALTINSQFRGDAVVFSNQGVLGKIIYFFLLPFYDGSYVGGGISQFSGYNAEANALFTQHQGGGGVTDQPRRLANYDPNHPTGGSGGGGGHTHLNFILASCMFWIIVALTAIFICGSINALFSDHQQLSRRTRFVVSSIVHPVSTFLLMPIVGTLASFMVCDVTDQRLFWYPQYMCSEPLSVAYFVIGVCALFFVVLVAWLTNAMLLDDSVVSKALTASAHSGAAERYVLAKVALVILFHVLNSKGYPLVYHCCVGAVGMLLALGYGLTMPFYRSAMNRFFGCFCAGAAGTAFAAVIILGRITTSQQGGGGGSQREADDIFWYSADNVGPTVGLIIGTTVLFALIGALLPFLRIDAYYRDGIDRIRHGAIVKDVMRRYPKRLPENDLVFSPHRGIEAVLLQKMHEEDEIAAALARQNNTTNTNTSGGVGGVGDGPHRRGAHNGQEGDVEMQDRTNGSQAGDTNSQFSTTGTSIGSASPRFLLTLLRPLITSIWISSDVEVAGRVLDEFNSAVGQIPPETMVAYVARIYTKGMAKFRRGNQVNLGIIHLHFTQLLLFYGGKQRAALAESEDVVRLCSGSFVTGYRANRLQTQLRSYLNHSDAAALKVLNSSLRIHKEILGHISLFWQRLLTQQNVDTIQLANIANVITTRRSQAMDQFHRVLQNPTRKLLVYYARFLEQVMMDTRRAQLIRTKIDEEAELRRQQQLNGTRFQDNHSMFKRKTVTGVTSLGGGGGGVGGGGGGFWENSDVFGGGVGDLWGMGGGDGADSDEYQYRSGVNPQTTSSSGGGSGSSPGSSDRPGNSSTSALRSLTTIMITMFLLLTAIVIGFFLFEHFRNQQIQTQTDRMVAASRQRSILPLGAFYTEQLRGCLMGGLITINAVDRRQSIMTTSTNYPSMTTLLYGNDTTSVGIGFSFSVESCTLENIAVWQAKLRAIGKEHYDLHQSLTTGDLAIGYAPATAYFNGKRIEIHQPSFDGRSLSGIMQRQLTDLWSLGNALSSHFDTIASFDFGGFVETLRAAKKVMAANAAASTTPTATTRPATTAAGATTGAPQTTASSAGGGGGGILSRTAMPSMSAIDAAHRSMQFIIMNSVPNIVPSYNVLLEYFEEDAESSSTRLFWIVTGLFAAAEVIVFIVYALVLSNFQRIGVQKLSALSLFTLIPRKHVESLLDKSRERFDQFDLNDDGNDGADLDPHLGGFGGGLAPTSSSSNHHHPSFVSAGGAANVTGVVADPQLMSGGPTVGFNLPTLASRQSSGGAALNTSGGGDQQQQPMSPERVAREHRSAQRQLSTTTANAAAAGNNTNVDAFLVRTRRKSASSKLTVHRKKRKGRGGHDPSSEEGSEMSEMDSSNGAQLPSDGSSSSEGDITNSSDSSATSSDGEEYSDAEGSAQRQRKAKVDGGTTSRSKQRASSRIARHGRRLYRWLASSFFTVLAMVGSVLLCATLVGLLYSLDGVTKDLVKQQDNFVAWTEANNNWYDRFTKIRTASVLFLGTGSQDKLEWYFQEWKDSGKTINTLYHDLLAFEENSDALSSLQTIRGLLDDILLRQVVAIWLAADAYQLPPRYQYALDRIAASDKFISYNMTLIKPTLDTIFSSFSVKTSPAPASWPFTDKALAAGRKMLVARSLIFDDLYTKHWTRIEQLRQTVLGQTSVGKGLEDLHAKHTRLFIASITIAAVTLISLLFLITTNLTHGKLRFLGATGSLLGAMASLAIIIISAILFTEVERMIEVDTIKANFASSKNTTLTGIPATLFKSRMFTEFGDKAAFHDYFSEKTSNSYFGNYADILDQLAAVGATESEVQSIFSTVSLLRSRTERVIHFGDVAILLAAWSYYGINATGGQRGDGFVTSAATTPVERELYQAVNLQYNYALELNVEKDTIQNLEPLSTLYTNNSYDSTQRTALEQKLIARSTLASTRFSRHWAAFKGNAEEFLSEGAEIIDRITSQKRTKVRALSSASVYIAAALLILTAICSMYSIYDILYSSFVVSDGHAASGGLGTFEVSKAVSSANGGSNKQLSNSQSLLSGSTSLLGGSGSGGGRGGFFGGGSGSGGYSLDMSGGGGSKAILLTEIAVRSRVSLILIAVVFAVLYTYDVVMIEVLRDVPYTINIAASRPSQLAAASGTAQRVFNGNRTAYSTPLSVALAGRVKALNTIRDELYLGSDETGNPPSRTQSHTAKLFGAIAPSTPFSSYLSTSAAAYSQTLSNAATEDADFEDLSAASVARANLAASSAQTSFDSSDYFTSKYSSECSSSVLNANAMTNIISFASSSVGARTNAYNAVYSSINAARTRAKGLTSPTVTALGTATILSSAEQLALAAASEENDVSSDIWRALSVNGVEDIVGQLLFIFDKIASSVDTIYLHPTSGQVLTPRLRLIDIRQRYEKVIAMVTGPLVTELQASTDLYVADSQSLMNALNTGHYCATAAVLALIILIFMFVLRPMLTMLAKEDDGTRLLLRMIPAQVRKEVPAVAEYLEYGTITQNIKLQRIAEISRELSTDALIVINEYGVMEHVSTATLNEFGYRTAAEMVGKNVKMIMLDHVARRHDGYLQRYQRTGIRTVLDNRRRVTAVRADGSTFTAEIIVREIFGGREGFGSAASSSILNGRAGFFGLIRNVSVEVSLENSQKLNEAVAEMCTDSIVVIDSNGIISRCNSAAFQTFGFSPRELLGKNVSILMPSAIGERHDGFLATYLSTRRSANVINKTREVTAIRKGGEKFVSLLTVKELLDDAGRVEGFIGVFKDMSTNFRIAQAALLNESVIHISPTPVIGFSTTGEITRFSPSACDAFGYTPADVVGRNISLLMMELGSAAAMAAAQKSAANVAAGSTNPLTSNGNIHNMLAAANMNSANAITTTPIYSASNTNASGGQQQQHQQQMGGGILQQRQEVHQYGDQFQQYNTTDGLQAVAAEPSPPPFGVLGQPNSLSPPQQQPPSDPLAATQQQQQPQQPYDITLNQQQYQKQVEQQQKQQKALQQQQQQQAARLARQAQQQQIQQQQYGYGNTNNIIPPAPHQQQQQQQQQSQFIPIVGNGSRPIEVPAMKDNSNSNNKTSSTPPPFPSASNVNPPSASGGAGAAPSPFLGGAFGTSESILARLVRHLREQQQHAAALDALAAASATAASTTATSSLAYRQSGGNSRSGAGAGGVVNGHSAAALPGSLSSSATTTAASAAANAAAFAPIRVEARTRDGVVLPVSVHLHDVTSPDGSTEYIAFLQDNRDEITHRRSAHLTSVLFQSSPVPLITADEDANILSCNSAAEKLVGYRKAQLVGSSAKMLMEARVASDHDSFLARFKAAGPNATSKIVDNHITINVRRGDGKVLPVEVMLRFVTQDSLMGKRRIFYLSMKDGTDATRLQEATGLSEAIGALYTVPMISISTNGIIVTYNVAAQGTFGYTEKEVVGRNVKLLMPDEIAVRHDEYLKNYLETRQGSMINQRRVVNYKHKNGEIRPAEIQIQEVNREDGETLYVSYIKDVRKDMVLESSASIASAIIDSSPLPIVIINAQGRVIRFSRAASNVLQWREEDIVGKNIKVLMQHEVAKVHDRYIRNYIKTGVKRMIGTTRQVMAMRKDGMAINVEVSVKETRRSELLQDYSNQIRVSSIDIFVPIDSRTSGSGATTRSMGMNVSGASGAAVMGGTGTGTGSSGARFTGSSGAPHTAAAGSTLTGSDPFSGGSGHDGSGGSVVGNLMELAGQLTAAHTVSQSSSPTSTRNQEDDDLLFIGYIHDLSQEYILRQSNELRDVILSESSIPIVQLDTDGRITYANPALAYAFDYSPEELVGHDAMVLVPDVSGQNLSFLSRFRPSPPPVPPASGALGAQHHHGGGERHHDRNNNNNYFNGMGDDVSISGVDSTPTSSIFGGTSTATAHPTAGSAFGDFHHLHQNGTFSPEQQQQQSHNGDNSEAGSGAVGGSNSGGSSSNVPIEAVARRRDGSEFPVEVHVREIVINKVRTYFSYLRNVEQLRLVKDEKLVGDTIIVHSSIPLVIISDRGVITEFNPAAEEVFGYSKRDVVGQSIGMLQPPKPPRQRGQGRSAAPTAGDFQNGGGAGNFFQRDSLSSNTTNGRMSTGRFSTATAGIGASGFRARILDSDDDSDEDDDGSDTATSSNATTATDSKSTNAAQQQQPLKDIYLDRLLRSSRLKHPFDLQRRIKAKRRDGTVFPMEVTLKEIVPSEESEGAPTVYVLYAKDLSHEETVESAQALAAAISTISQTPFVCVNGQGQITMFSKAAEAEFGYTADEIMGKDVSVLQQTTATATDNPTSPQTPGGVGGPSAFATTYGGTAINQYSLKALMRNRYGSGGGSPPAASFVPEVHARLIGKRRNGSTFTMDVDVRHFDEGSTGGDDGSGGAGGGSPNTGANPERGGGGGRGGGVLGALSGLVHHSTKTNTSSSSSRFFNYAAAACLRNVTEEVESAINSLAYSKIVELTGAPLVVINERGIIETCNAALEEVYGYTSKELIGRNVKTLMLPEVAAHHDGYLASYLETGQKKVLDQHRRVYSVTKQQRIILTELFVHEMVTPQLKKRNFYGFLRDLTQQLSLHQAFSLSDAITDLSPVPIIAIDVKGTILKFSAASSKLFEYEANGPDGVVEQKKNVSILMRHHDAVNHDGYLHDAKAKGYVGAARKVVGVSRTGRLISLELSISPVMHGKVVMSYVGFLRDMTSQDRLEADRHINREIAAYSKQPIIVITHRGVIDSINRHALQLFGYANESQCVGQNVAMLMPRDVGAVHDSFIDTFLRGGRNKRAIDAIRTVQAVGSRGETIPIDIGVKELNVPGSEPKFLAFIHTVSDHMVRQESLSFNDALFSLAPAAYVLADTTGRIILMSEICCQMFGYGRNEVINNNVKMLMPAAIASVHDTYLANYIHSGVKKILDVDVRVTGVRRNGEAFDVSVGVKEITGKDGQRFFVAFFKESTVTPSALQPANSINVGGGGGGMGGGPESPSPQSGKPSLNLAGLPAV